MKSWEEQIKNSTEIEETESNLYAVEQFIKHHIKKIN
jgi:hypothetical protein